ncbi:DinB family protein [Lutibacter sp.]|uniref:DinB family protein n=1 Tax=Lutibacter sp. TaxID=1925666 RepID=UPI0035614A7E
MNSIYVTENEYAPFYKNYIKALGNVNLFEVLNRSLNDIVNTVKELPEEKLTYQYAKGKWTIKELVQHIIDTERVLSYRALRFSRNDTTNLQGFDENWYVDNSYGNNRSITDLLDELSYLRKANISLFKSFTNEMFKMSGTANGSEMTVRAIGFIIAGHQMHHLNIIKEKYLNNR